MGASDAVKPAPLFRRPSLKALSAEQVAELQEAFAVFDTTNTGAIEPDALSACLKQLGIHVTEGQLLDLVRKADLEGIDRVSFESFASMMKNTFLLTEQTGPLLEAFRAFDTDKDGLIHEAELRGTMGRIFGADIEEQEMRDMVAVAGLSDGGTMDFPSFARLLSDTP